MKLFSTLILILSTLAGFSQTDTPGYVRFPTIPPYELLGVDSSTIYTKAQLRPGKAVLLMYFSPECDHCRLQTDDLLKDIKKLENIEIVMATYQPFESLKSFYEKYSLKNYPNITIGRDSKFILPPFYRMPTLPYLALYDKGGQLITVFRGNQPMSILFKSFDGQL